MRGGRPLLVMRKGGDPYWKLSEPGVPRRPRLGLLEVRRAADPGESQGLLIRPAASPGPGRLRRRALQPLSGEARPSPDRCALAVTHGTGGHSRHQPGKPEARSRREGWRSPDRSPGEGSPFLPATMSADHRLSGRGGPVIHPFAEHVAYFLLFAIPLFTMVQMGTASIMSFAGYVTYIDLMNNMGHCNFELIPKWIFSYFPPLKYLMYTPSFHSLHHTQFRTNYSLIMPF
ncbi:hypothetical protein NL676_012060 [Syzygium grande]|nr:hypothetical protein NL676_012060 [Syzygium grande]